MSWSAGRLYAFAVRENPAPRRYAVVKMLGLAPPSAPLMSCEAAPSGRCRGPGQYEAAAPATPLAVDFKEHSNGSLCGINNELDFTLSNRRKDVTAVPDTGRVVYEAVESFEGLCKGGM